MVNFIGPHDFGGRKGAIAALVGAGYVLLVIWLFMVAQTLFRRGGVAISKDGHYAKFKYGEA